MELLGFLNRKLLNFYILPDDSDYPPGKDKEEHLYRHHFGRSEQFIFHKMVNMYYVQLHKLDLQWFCTEIKKYIKPLPCQEFFG